MRSLVFILTPLCNVLLLTTIGVPVSTWATRLTTHGNRISIMAIRTTTIRTTQTMCVLFGIFKQTIFKKPVGGFAPDSVFLTLLPHFQLLTL